MHATGYEPALPRQWLQKGLVSYGDMSRTRVLLAGKLLRGEPITAVVVGGSVTWGQGANERGVDDYGSRLFQWIRETFSDVNHTFVNAGVPGTPSSYMALCLNWHVPQDADLVVVEYNINDGGEKYDDHPIRRAHERMLRKLLSYPRRPAVIELVVYRWPSTQDIETAHVPYRYHGDDEIGVLAQYYHLPWLSSRSLMWDQDVGSDTAWREWMADPDHPNTLGHRYFADMVIGYLRRVVEELQRHPLDEADEAAVAAPMPPPMLKDNWPVMNNTCLMGSLAQRLATGQPRGFAWVNEADDEKPKWGWVATQPGSSITLKIDTALGLLGKPGRASLVVAYLRSYEHMGVMEVRCVSGCNCEPLRLNGHTEEQHSQTAVQAAEVSRADVCLLRATVLNETDSGEHKAKIVGVIISPDTNDHGVKNAQPIAVDFEAIGKAAYSG